MTHLEAVTQAMAKLSVEEKVRLLTGGTAWSLHPLQTIRLRSMVVSDGPVGVRGVRDDPADWSLLFPAPSALAATWDVQAARQLGDLFATEARRKGVDVILAPVVNLQRTPVGGRHLSTVGRDSDATPHVPENATHNPNPLQVERKGCRTTRRRSTRAVARPRASVL